jgi:hypothetical protein
VKPLFATLLLLAVLFFAGMGCGSNKPFVAHQPAIAEAPSGLPLYSVFLVGDAGAPDLAAAQSPLPALQSKLQATGSNSAVVFLGDNLYFKGLPDSTAPDRTAGEAKLTAQLDILYDYPGRVFFIPGNHDWGSSSRDGLQRIRRMEEFIESFLGRGNVFVPDEGFPGPVDIKLVDKDTSAALSRDIHLIALDTQWWLHPYEKPFGDTGEYDLHDSGDFINELNSVMLDRQNDHLVVVGHHPLFSNGVNGGHFPAKRHLLPPIGGTAYVLYRKFFGLPQDIANYRYQLLKEELLSAFDKAESLVYASGHEHLLQHTISSGHRNDHHFIVSGTGSMTDYAAKGHGAEFVASEHGFAVVNYFADQSTWLEFWDYEGKLIYRRQLLSPNENPFANTVVDTTSSIPKNLADSSRVLAANSDYDSVGWIHETILGSHNRDLWSIPVEVPVFDVGKVQGGLEVIKIGGTGQTTSLRLADAEGRTYVLRSVDKEAGRIWDATMRNTFAEDLAQDQFSIINPYGAFMMPPLAEAVEVFHTKPELYVVPNDPRLGRFAEMMHGQLALFEERPDDDMSDAPHLSGSDEVLSTRDMILEVNGDIDHRVDQQMMLRNRLLDMLVSDWDRHDDQWRWAAVEPTDKKGKIYQPIPRDRDMAFMVMNGLVPSVGKVSFFKNYQDFRSSYGNLKGLTENSLSLTLRFTNQLTKQEWLTTADSMKVWLSDSVITAAIRELPRPVLTDQGTTIANILRERRDKLPQVADRYYDLLAKVVDIHGSDKRELFVIESLPDNKVRVQVYKLKKDGEKARSYYDRTFHTNESQELRLYGMGGSDLFEVRGAPANKIKIRLIGGSGGDTFIGNSVSTSKIPVYDNADGSTFQNIFSFRLNTSEQPDAHAHAGFKYNSVDPLLYFGSNRDDGVFLGGGVQITRHGFRKQPAAAIHRIRANFAAETEAFNLRYDGFFADVSGSWDGVVNIDALLPNNIRNFYGLGNETSDQNREDDFYQARLWQFRVKPALQHAIATGISVSAGPFFQVTQVKDDEGRFIGQPQLGISPSTFEDQWFTGVHGSISLQALDNSLNPMQGFRWANNGVLNLGIRNTSKTYSSLSSTLSMYWSPVFDPQLTLATRVGVEHNIGSFPFYDANTLGGKKTLRGLFSNRYAGRTSFYNNVELRSKLFDFHSYLLGGQLGLFGFFDHGRVWTDGESSNLWHYGAGGGLWMSLFDLAVIRGSLGFSEGGYNMLIGAGFFF